MVKIEGSDNKGSYDKNGNKQEATSAVKRKADWIDGRLK